MTVGVESHDPKNLTLSELSSYVSQTPKITVQYCRLGGDADIGRIFCVYDQVISHLKNLSCVYVDFTVIVIILLSFPQELIIALPLRLPPPLDGCAVVPACLLSFSSCAPFDTPLSPPFTSLPSS